MFNKSKLTAGYGILTSLSAQFSGCMQFMPCQNNNPLNERPLGLRYDLTASIL